MKGYDSTPDEQRIEGALEVVSTGNRAFVKIGDLQVPVPTVRSTEQELDGFNGFLARTQLGAIERRRQKEMREILKIAEVDILRERTKAIVEAHKGVTKAALVEIMIAAREYGLSKIRDAEKEDQAELQRYLWEISIQYEDFAAQLEDMKDTKLTRTFGTLMQSAWEIYEDKLQKIRASDFKVQ